MPVTADKRVAGFLHSGDYDRLHQGAAGAAAAASGARPVEVFVETRGYPTAEALRTAARATGLCKVFACSASMEMLGVRPDRLEPLVDSILGWSGILARTEGVTARFYL